MEEDKDFVSYSDRLEWKDVTPIPQDDGEHPVVRIAYSDKYRNVFDYFRAILAKREVSERALLLSEDAAKCNPSNYTVWHYRRVLLKELQKDIDQEFTFIQNMIAIYPKNYQLWHHRQVLVEWQNDASQEKDFIADALEGDPKNYHAWQYRQWVVRTFNLWQGELAFVTELIEDDIRNNSAWNHRFYIVSQDLNDDVIKDEIQYTLKKICKAPNNESPWNYLRGLLQDKGLSYSTEVVEFTETLYAGGCRSPHLMHFLIDGAEEKLLVSPQAEILSKALEMCASLAKTHDTIRKAYWKFLARNLLALYGPCEGLTDEDKEFLQN